MQKSEWLVVFLFFSALLFVTSDPVLVSADDNLTNMTHLECVNQSCIQVNNTLNNTVNLCQTSNDCLNQTNGTVYVNAVRANRTVTVNLTHLECVNQACTLVDGVGVDLCQTNAQCNLTNMTRNICIGQTCTLVNITDINITVMDCSTNLDCQNNTGGGNGTNFTGGGKGGSDLPLAPPAQTTAPSRTLAGYIINFFRNITGLFGL